MRLHLDAEALLDVHIRTYEKSKRRVPIDVID